MSEVVVQPESENWWNREWGAAGAGKHDRGFVDRGADWLDRPVICRGRPGLVVVRGYRLDSGAGTHLPGAFPAGTLAHHASGSITTRWNRQKRK